MGARGPFLQHRESRGIELVDHIAHGLVVAAQQPSNRRGSFPARRCSQDLAATHHKGIGRTQSRLDLVLFVLGERSNKNGCSHAFYSTTLPNTSGGIALGAAGLPYRLARRFRRRALTRRYDQPAEAMVRSRHAPPVSF